MLSQTRLAVQHQLDENPVTVEELRNCISEPPANPKGSSDRPVDESEDGEEDAHDQGLSQRILSYAANATGSSTYW